MTPADLISEAWGRLEFAGLWTALEPKLDIVGDETWLITHLALRCWVPDAEDPILRSRVTMRRTAANHCVNTAKDADLAIRELLRSFWQHELEEGVRLVGGGFAIRDPHPERSTG